MQKLLDEMRGATSLPLEQTLCRALMDIERRDMNYFTGQVPSQTLAKGISMIVRADSSLEVQLYYAREEIGGFMPPKIRRELTHQGWLIVGDVYKRKYAGAIATFGKATM